MRPAPDGDRNRLPARRLAYSGVAALIAFGAVAAAVSTGLTASTDEGLAGAAGRLRLASPAWLVESARDVTALGSNVVAGLLVIGAATYAAAVGARVVALWFPVVFGGSLLWVGLAKVCVGRLRPEIAGQAARVFTTSFPSSHATVSAALSGFLALVLLRAGAAGSKPGPVIALLSLVPVLVGLSRMFLGLHWLSDVVAGWALGLSWACLCGAGARRWTRPTDDGLANTNVPSSLP